MNKLFSSPDLHSNAGKDTTTKKELCPTKIYKQKKSIYLFKKIETTGVQQFSAVECISFCVCNQMYSH